jgi:hypothetical protein
VQQERPIRDAVDTDTVDVAHELNNLGGVLRIGTSDSDIANGFG